jgi:excisionase family DNA binding protein
MTKTISVAEAAKQLSVSASTIKRWIKEKRLIAERHGLRSWKIKQSDVDRIGAMKRKRKIEVCPCAGCECLTGENGVINIMSRKGESILIDACNHEWATQYTWFTSKNYAVRSKGARITRRHISMHREILGLEHGDKREGDHKNGNTLDNRRCNLRISTRSQNQWNRKNTKKGASKYKGVWWNKQANKWSATITKNGQSHYLGLHHDELDAARAYDAAARKLFGEFAAPNFPDTEQ